MIFKSPAMRLSVALVLLLVNLLFLANLMGFVPDESESALELRKSLSESLALQFSAAAEKGEFQTIQNTLRAVVQRNEDIRSAAIRTNDGQLIALAGEHLAHWEMPADGKSTPTHIHVPVFKKNKQWAHVEIRFAPLWTENLASGFTNSFVGLLLFLGLSSFVCYFFVIKRTLRELDPSAVIPERVQKAFDVLQEGVLILDNKEQIVMANKSFANLLSKPSSAMIGLKGSELGWSDCQDMKQVRQLPWFKVMQGDEEQKSASLSLVDKTGNTIKLAVTAARVTDSTGKSRGSLVTFDDITKLEEKNFELNDLVEKLQLTHEEIQSKSKELEFLANRDPLTLCLNRRSLDRKFDILFSQAKAEGKKLSCIMADIDFFKSVNDKYGHSIGDQVIKAVAEVLKECTRDTDLVSRYGGEEFCVVLPNLDLEIAAQIAERVRQTIEKKSCAGVQVTVSLGVSSLESNANKPDELVNQADKALYAAKNSGRNRVISWGEKDQEQAESLTDGTSGQSSEPDDQGPVAQPGVQKSDQLLRRVQELEGMLEKRTLEVEHYELYDIHTGFATRTLFEDRISCEIAKSRRKKHLVVVLSITVDTINRVYEAHGHSAAGQLVKACGSRLNDVLREDIDTVAVLEDIDVSSSISLINLSEFGILLTDIQQIDHVTWVIKRILESFEKPFQIKDREIYASAYIGIGIFPYDGQSVEELYSSATNASSYAQRLKGNNRYLFATQDINQKAVKLLQIENLLHKAIQADELYLAYQPKIESVTGRITRFEALLRWRNSQFGMIPPDDFISIAEQSGQIDKLGDWVMRQSCQQLRAWLDMGLDIESVAINLSGVQLKQMDLTRRIKETLHDFNLEPQMLEIELTESSLVKSSDKSFSVLKQINELGIKVTMDDFGTGYSSLTYLKNIPLSCIKIDRSFTAEVGQNKNTEKLVASIVSMALGLGLEVVAEGIEEKEQADFMAGLGCQYLQGYYFSKPVPEPAATEILQKEFQALKKSS